MRALLMHPDRDFDLAAPLTGNAGALADDLGLGQVLDAMAAGDSLVRGISEKAILCAVCDVATVAHRQAAVRDAMNHPGVIRDLYRVVSEAIKKEHANYLGNALSRYPEYVLRRAVEVMRVFVEMFEKLRRIGDPQAQEFRSEAFGLLFAMFSRELSDEYLDTVKGHLGRLEFHRGILVSAGLGPGNKATPYVLRKPNTDNRRFLERFLAQGPPAYTFRLDPRDEGGANALSELRGRGLNIAANTLAQSADHVLGFTKTLQAELAFYVGCLDLRDRLAVIGESVCLPSVSAEGETTLSFDGLYDASLALASGRQVVGNDLKLDGKKLVMITGPNQGGKSTFLRSLGIAQLMARCGMFVPARSLAVTLSDRLFTHFKREEDAEMCSGKFDEELSRMNDLVDDMTPASTLLMNESFAATNEREGSEIGRQIVRALVEKGIRVYYVTHFYDLANSFWAQSLPNAAFLRAERMPDGQRTFRVVAGEPQQDIHAEDLYVRIFTEDGDGSR